jgi:hypothetical protein
MNMLRDGFVTVWQNTFLAALLLAMPGMGLLLFLFQTLIGGLTWEVVVGALFGALFLPFLFRHDHL